MGLKKGAYQIVAFAPFPKGVNQTLRLMLPFAPTCAVAEAMAQATEALAQALGDGGLLLTEDASIWYAPLMNHYES